MKYTLLRKKSGNTSYLFTLIVMFCWCFSSIQAMAVDERILPLGNSITQADRNHNSYRRALWFKLLDEGYQVDFVGSWDTNHSNQPPPDPDFDRDNEGHWGWRTDELLAGLPAWLQGYTPDIVLLHAGTNDVLQGNTIDSAVVNLKAMIDELRSVNPQVTVLLAQLIPTSDSAAANAGITELNTRMPEIVTEKDTAQSPVILVDQNTGFDAVGDTYDGIHPNSQGEEKMAQRWFDSLTGLLSNPVDTLPPFIEDIQIGANNVQLIVVFNEPLDLTTAEDTSNYTVDQGIGVLAATLEADNRTVTLDVDQLVEDIEYILTVNGVLDLADPPNSTNDAISFMVASGGGEQFVDDFERADSANIGNGWIEKGEGLFSIINGEVFKDRGGYFKRNLVYRPASETLLDVEASVEFRLLQFPAEYPQVHVRIDPSTVEELGDLDSYFLMVADENTVRLSRQNGGGGFTNLAIITPSEPLVVSNKYRLVLAAEGENPTLLQGSIERWSGSAWLPIGSASAEDDSSRQKGQGTVGFSDNARANVVYDNFKYQSLGATNTPFPAGNPSPANGATDVVTTAQLGWSDGGGATSYDLYFGTTNPPAFTGEQTETTYDPGSLTENMTYYWRVDAKNSAGTTTGTLWSFTTEAGGPPLPEAPENPSPATGATDVLTSTQLSWSDGGGASSYEVSFGTSNPPPFIGEQAGTSYDPGVLTEDTIYYWRIDAKNVTGTTPGAVWSFTTEAGGPPLPDPAQNPSPLAGATDVPTDAQISWTGSGATSYDVYFSASNPPVYMGEQTGSSYDPGPLEVDTLYYWRIDAKNSAGTTAGTLWSFTTESGGPSLPQPADNPSPGPGSTAVAIDTDVNWSNGGGATSYDVYFGTSNPPLYIGEQTTTTYDPGVLDEDTLYYWRIDPINSAGTTTGTVWNFTTRNLSGGFTFSDDFQRPDSEVIGNGWIEKGPALFSLAGGEVVKARGGYFKRNLVYRPAVESLLDVEASIEFRLLQFPAEYPQIHVRISTDTVEDDKYLESYFMMVADENTVRLSRQNGRGGFSNLDVVTLSESLLVGERYRLNITATGENPVTLQGTVERWSGSDWLNIGSAAAADDSSRQKGVGTVGFSDNVRANVVYDSFYFGGYLAE